MTKQANTTVDHEEIKHWIKSRGGKPVSVSGTGGGADPGLLRVDFPGYGEDSDDPGSDLEELTWDDFFQKFEDSQLAFLHQDETANGEESRFYKFVSR